MRQPQHTAPKLPKALLDQIQGPGSSKQRRGAPTRKDRRKAERQQNKVAKSSRPVARKAVQVRDDLETDEEGGLKPSPSALPNSKSPLRSANQRPKGPKSTLKKTQRVNQEVSSGSEHDLSPAAPAMSRAVKDRIADDDAEIAALEKRLGLKGKKQRNSSKLDGLGYLLEGSNGEEDAEDARGMKRKRPEDVSWLKDKRRKAGGALRYSDDRDGASGERDIDNADSDETLEQDNENPFSEDEVGSDAFESFDYEQEREQRPRIRENPYVAPVPKDAAPIAKYIPPSMRTSATSDTEALQRLRRQTQGLLNRLSETNILSIVQSVEQNYDTNARQHVTSTILDLLIGLVCDRASLNDVFLILHAGFAAALHKTVGIDFSAQLLERIVEAFDRYRSSEDSEGKETSNLIGFLSYLYTFQVVGSTVVFDFVRFLAQEVSERNTELLLRIVTTSGSQLRQDDPLALKDIVVLIQRAVSHVGEDKVSVRTKFMIETINNLKNNRVKTGAAASALRSEHTVRMKRTVGSLNTRSVKATEPLRTSLADVRDAEKKGKWWLVGASYHDPAKLANGRNAGRKETVLTDEQDETNGEAELSLQQLARSQGMNTDIRRAIFITLLSAADYKDANLRLLKLHLKSKQQLEIPRVLQHCAGAEQVYNPYYTLIAKRLCAEKKLAKAFQSALLDLLRRTAESDADGDDDDQLADDGAMGLKKVVNLAKMYGTLVADGGLSLTALKTLNFAYLQSKTATFAEVLLTTLLLRWHMQRPDRYEAATKTAFAAAQDAPQMVQGLQYFLRSTVAKAEIVSSKAEREVVKRGCRYAVEALSAPAVRGADVEAE